VAKLPAGMVNVLEPAVLRSSSVPDQALICHPVVGTAPLKLINSPAMYWPLEQPGELDGSATGSEPWPVWLSVSA